MNNVSLIARYLLGLIFVVFGLNKFHIVIPQPEHVGLGAMFIQSLCLSHYFWVVATLEVAGGILLLANRYVPLGLTMLGPVVMNIMLFHLIFERGNLPFATFIVLEWLLVFWPVRSAFSGIFAKRVDPAKDINDLGIADGVT